MRLICPNCDAQYEVPDDVIPAAGRDVQCSNCAHTWFCPPTGTSSPQNAEPDVTVAPPPPVAAERSPSPQSQTSKSSSEPPQAPERRQLDPKVADVLREEAEFEARARAAEQAQIETQTELGLDDLEPHHDEAARRAAEARTRMERIRGGQEGSDEASSPTRTSRTTATTAAGAVAAAAAAETTRRDLLPDVEEINSTLRANDDRTSQQDIEEPHREFSPKQKGGFSSGFLLIAALAATGVMMYVFAPQISEQVPQASVPLDQYVDSVDQGRRWLDGQILALLAQLDGLTERLSNAAADDGAKQPNVADSEASDQ